MMINKRTAANILQSGFYPVQGAVSKGQPLLSLFSTTDEDFHAKYRRCVNNAFAMSSLVNYEPLVSSTLTYWLDKTDDMFASTGKSCNFSQWLQFFAFDVIGDLTWSKRLGFVEGNKDVDNIIGFLGKFFDYVAPVSPTLYNHHNPSAYNGIRSVKCQYSIVFSGKTPSVCSLSALALTSVFIQ
jgi:hypothetical protein